MSTNNETRPSVHLVCQAHIDPVWIWDWPEGLTETLATFETAADLLDEYPEFVFNHNESLLYEWTQENKPELFERIKAHVNNGRWVISGGWYLQPDMNLPSGESIARQILIGRRYFSEQFGVEPKVAYNLDTFGHNANTPQFLKLAGYRMYTHFRPTPSDKQLPDFLYTWRGVDGSEVIGFRPPCGWYCTHPGSLVENKFEQMSELAKERGRPTTMFWGAGDHGGGATRADLELIRRIASEHPELTHSSFERYLDEVAEAESTNLPTVSGELQKCFTGCYTSIIENKLRNRRGEGLALAAERFAALAWWLLDESYPASRLERVWKDVLFNQFHDILPGSSIREGAISEVDMTGRSATDAKEILVKSQLALMRNTEASEPLTVRVFNPHPVSRRIPAIVDVQLATHPFIVHGKYLAMYDASGNEVARQLLGYRRNTAEWRNTFLFYAELPAMGIAEYRIAIEDSSATGASATASTDKDPDAFLYVDGRQLSDTECRVADHTPWITVDDDCITVTSDAYTATMSKKTGLIDSLTDDSGYEYLAAASSRLIVRNDSNDAWGGTQFAYGPVAGEFALPDPEELSEITGQYGERRPVGPVRIIASGPLAVVVESVFSYKRSVARVRYTFYRGHDAIDVELLVDWNERRRALQLEFATTLVGGLYEAEIPHASVQRARGGGEEPVGRWVMLSREQRSLALINNGPGGVEIDRAKIRQSLVRSPVYCSGNSAVEPGFLGEHMDLGEHIYRFRILCGKSESVVAKRQFAADDLTLPFSFHVSVPLGASSPGLPAGTDTASVTRLDGDGAVHLEAMKMSEDGKALVVRLAERTGKNVRIRLSVPKAKTSELEFGPFEMKTLRFEKSKGNEQSTGIACDLLERPFT